MMMSCRENQKSMVEGRWSRPGWVGRATEAQERHGAAMAGSASCRSGGPQARPGRGRLERRGAVHGESCLMFSATPEPGRSDRAPFCLLTMWCCIVSCVLGVELVVNLKLSVCGPGA